MERNENPINLGYFLENISYHIMNILIPVSANIRHNYFVTLMIIKILNIFVKNITKNFKGFFA